MSLLLPYATTGLSLIAGWCLIGATLQGQLRTPAMRRPHGCEGLRVRRMTVLWTFRRPFMGRPVPRQLLRNALLDLGSSQGPQLEVYTLHSPLDAIQQC
jgi:hypothetical protein